MERINTKLKRLTALILTVAMVVSSNAFSSATYVFADETESSGEMIQTESLEDTTGVSVDDPVEDTTDSLESDTYSEESTPVSESSSETTAETTQESTETTTETADQTDGEPTETAVETSTEPAAASNSLEPRDGAAQFDFSARVNDSEILAGGDFNYTIEYTALPTASGGTYNSASFTLILPEHVSFRKNADGTLSYEGSEVTSVTAIEQSNGTTYVTINMNPSGMGIGGASSIVLNLTTDNFETPDGTEITLNPTFSATTATDRVEGSLTAEEIEAAKVTVRTQDDWTVKKSAGDVNVVTGGDGKEYYEVAYTIIAQNLWNGADSQGDHDGRLDVESFALTDIMPTGYPEGGGVSEIVSVKMGQEELSEGSDGYDIDRADDGSVESIVIHKYSVSDSNQSTIEEGKPITTTYTVTVRYPREAYETPSNIPDAVMYQLTNTASLEYKLLGKDTQTKTAEATIEVGYKETTTDDFDIVVDKLLSIDGEEYSIAGSGKEAAFELYGDDGKTLANNADGTVVVGAEKTTDDSGRVAFEGLRRGTYYLKETKIPKGFLGNGQIKIEISGDGTITAGAVDAGDTANVSVENGVVSVVNVADSVGGVRFTKYATDPEGHTAVQEGATFTLTDQSDSSKTYTAVSGSDGTVYFAAVPAGTYTLEETGVPSDEYEISSKTITVEVWANQITELNDSLDPITLEDGAQVKGFLNVSPKGKFQIRKEDSISQATLSGAEFKVYGPYASEDAVPDTPSEGDLVADYTLTTGENGTAVSKALLAGWYILEETKAPADHAITDSSRYTVVQVKANQISDQPIVIKNEPTVDVTFSKKGAVRQNGETIVVEELADVELAIYASQDAEAPIATVKTYLDGTGISTSDPIELLPGTYYYEEVTGPGGDYQELDGRHAFTVERNSSNQWVVTVYNYSEYGRIRVKKVDASDDNVVLEGAKFEIWNADDNGQSTGSAPVGTIVTGTDGYGVSGLIPVGSYILKEVSAPAGYGVTSVWSSVIKVTQGSQSEETITNDPMKSVIVTKVDENNDGLAGAKFAIYEGTDVSGIPLLQETTGSDGTCTFVGLKPGTVYTIVEIEAPSGYTEAAYTDPSDPNKIIYRTFTVTTPAGSSTTQSVSVGPVENYKQVDFSFTKYSDMDDPTGSTPLAGAEFTLYRYDTDAQDHIGMEVAKATSDTSGQVSFTNVDAKVWDGQSWTDAKYVLRETVTPDGYTTAADQIITIGNDGKVYIDGTQQELSYVLNRADQGKVAVEKYATEADGVTIDTDTPVQAVFEIHKVNGDGTISDEVVGTITTSGRANTPVTSGWLDPGQYALVETSVTGNYTMDTDPILFTVTAGQTTQLTGEYALTNVAKGQVRLHKVASFKISGSAGQTAEYDLTGSVIRLYKKSSDTSTAAEDITDLDAFADEINMESSATGTTKYLDAGDYWIVEWQFPEDYKAGEGSTTITVDGEDITVLGSLTIRPGQQANDSTVDITNYTDKGKLRINKLEYGTDRLLDGAQFEVYIEDANGDVTTPTGVKVKKVYISSSTDAGGEIMESGTDGDGTGSALSIDIEPGTYWIREVSVDKVNQQYGPSWYPYNGEWSGPITVEKGSESVQKFYNFKMTGPGTKVDEAGQPLEGAIFVAFEDTAKASDFVSYLKTLNVGDQDANGNYTNKAALEKKLKDTAFLEQYGIVDVSSPSLAADGSFEFDALKPGGTYHIVEAIPPDGYALNTDVFTRTVKNDGTGFTETLKVVDYLLRRFSVKKVTQLNGTEYTVEGVTFSVYEAVQDENGSYELNGVKYSKASETPVASGSSGADGLYTTVLLEAGFYIIEETGVPQNSPVRLPDDIASKSAVIQIKAGDDGTTIAKTFNNPAVYGQFIFKKVDQNGDLITDATITFQLYRQTSDNTWEEVGDEITAPSSGDGIYKSGLLPAGTYKLVETSAPGYTIKYTQDNPLIFTIEGGKITGSLNSNDTPSTDATIDQPLVLTNTKQGTLTLQKVGVFEGKVIESNLQGIQFTLYTDPGCTQAVLTQTTDANGQARWTNLDAGTYYLKETGIVSGSEADGKYAVDDTVRTIVITAGQSVSLTGDAQIENATTLGTIRIKKVDANDPDKVLSGAIFGVYQTVDGKEVEVTRMTTGTDGIAESSLIPAGDYYVKEITPPSDIRSAKRRNRSPLNPIK